VSARRCRRDAERKKTSENLSGLAGSATIKKALKDCRRTGSALLVGSTVRVTERGGGKGQVEGIIECGKRKRTNLGASQSMREWKTCGGGRSRWKENAKWGKSMCGRVRGKNPTGFNQGDLDWKEAGATHSKTANYRNAQGLERTLEKSLTGDSQGVNAIRGEEGDRTTRLR